MEIDDIVDHLLTQTENTRKWTQETGFIVAIKEKKDTIKLTVRPRLHCPEVDAYDTIDASQITAIQYEDGSINVWDMIEYIV